MASQWEPAGLGPGHLAGFDRLAPEHFERPLLHAVAPGGVATKGANPQALFGARARRRRDREPGPALANQGEDGADTRRAVAERAGFHQFRQDLVGIGVLREQRVHPGGEFEVRFSLPGQPALLFIFEGQCKFHRDVFRNDSRKRMAGVLRRQQNQSAQQVSPEDGHPQDMGHAEGRAEQQVAGLARNRELRGFSNRKQIQGKRELHRQAGPLSRRVRLATLADFTMEHNPLGGSEIVGCRCVQPHTKSFRAGLPLQLQQGLADPDLASRACARGAQDSARGAIDR